MSPFDTSRLDSLSSEEAGAAVFEELRRTGHTVSFGSVSFGSKGATVHPRLRRDHPLYPWLYELGVYLSLRCSRCSTTSTRGLTLAYWGEWLCRSCVEELTKPGGELDARGWPDPIRGAA